MSWIVALWRVIWLALSLTARWLRARWLQKPILFRHQLVEEFPDTLQAQRVYLAGGGQNLWAAAMICPCGCRDVIQLNLLQQARPCWSVEVHKDGTVSLRPSVWRSKWCRSHFIVSHGRVQWC